MSLFAVSDLHLSLCADKPMEVFGEQWQGHFHKIRESWERLVSDGDTVIVAGDISWAMRLSEALPDLSFLDKLPGRKILVKGNHDYWWGSLKKNNDAFPGLCFLQNNFYAYDDYAVCGSRGWPYAADSSIPEDLKIYERELLRLRLSFHKAKSAGYKRFICVTHFPPVGFTNYPTAFSEIIEEYGTEYAVFGHLHGNDCKPWKNGGLFGKCRYLLTSCDFLGFDLIRVI